MFRRRRNPQTGRAGLAVGLACLALAFCTPHALAPVQPRATSRSQTVLDAVRHDPRFRTFSRAVDSAGLVSALRTRGPFTVLAPTDEAFDRLGKDELSRLFRPENKARLAAILKYHVLNGRHFPDELVEAGRVETVNGQRLRIIRLDAGVRVNEAGLLDRPIETDNGLVLTLDAVLLPSEATIAQALRSDERLTTFARLLADADLLEKIAADAPATVFAPTNDALASIGTPEDLKADPDRLRLILQNHIIPDRRMYLDEGDPVPRVKTRAGINLPVRVREGVFQVGPATVTERNLDLANGVLHICDRLIDPN